MKVNSKALMTYFYCMCLFCFVIENVSVLAADDLVPLTNTTEITVLNGHQALYYQWTEMRFREFLLRSNLANTSPSTRDKLEAFWLRRAKAALKRDWSKYTSLFDYSEQDYETFEAINTLAALRSKKAVPILISIAAQNVAKDNRERWMAIRALGLIGDKSAVPYLVQLTNHYNSNTRLWSQISLVRLTGKNFGYNTGDWSTWAIDNGLMTSKATTEWKLSSDATPNDISIAKDPKLQVKEDMKFFEDLTNGQGRVPFN